MKWHVLRPLWLTIGVVASILVARVFLVPDDFGVHGRNFTYGYYRLSNVQEWKDFTVKYQGRESCRECHEENLVKLNDSPHAAIECENCHGPAIGHPDPVEMLPNDLPREHCLRCHATTDFPFVSKAQVPMVNNRMHRRRRECYECHNPHDPREEVE